MTYICMLGHKIDGKLKGLDPGLIIRTVSVGMIRMFYGSPLCRTGGCTP